jgi:hypothetical protein
MAGDCAAIVTASTTAKFLTSSDGMAIHEILCKARSLTIARPKAAVFPEPTQGILPVVEGTLVRQGSTPPGDAITLVPKKGE